MMSKAIPARWLPYEAMGDSIEGTRFISFKVPLKEEICNKLAPRDRFTPRMLVEMLEGRLGLVVDLTNTNRYYNPEELRLSGINYVKIYCEGKKVPNTSVVAKFYAAVDDYLQKNPENGNLIGVHCTHGVNRTGYLICRYMIDKLGFQPDAAISAFNKARHHNQERQQYLDALRLSAGDDSGAQEEDTDCRSQSTEYSGGASTQWKVFREPPTGRQNSSRPQRYTPRVRDNRWSQERGPPPRPPARAGWHASPSNPPPQQFGGYPGQTPGFCGNYSPVSSYHNYQDSRREYNNYCGSHDSSQTYGSSNSGFHNFSNSDYSSSSNQWGPNPSYSGTSSCLGQSDFSFQGSSRPVFKAREGRSGYGEGFNRSRRS